MIEKIVFMVNSKSIGLFLYVAKIKYSNFKRKHEFKLQMHNKLDLPYACSLTENSYQTPINMLHGALNWSQSLPEISY